MDFPTYYFQTTVDQQTLGLERKAADNRVLCRLFKPNFVCVCHVTFPGAM